MARGVPGPGSGVLVVLAPLNLLLAARPEEMGLESDGHRKSDPTVGPERGNVVDAAWVEVDWTLRRALRTARFWWIAVGYATGMFAWYAVQVHQTKYLVEVGDRSTDAAWALGFVSLVAVPGQIALGHLSDRIGREWVWTAGSLGFAICYLALLLMPLAPAPTLLYVMVAAQGMLGYGLTSVIGAIAGEVFEGRHYGTIFGALMVAAIGGGGGAVGDRPAARRDRQLGGSPTRLPAASVERRISPC